MGPLGIHGVSVEASANTSNPLHNGEDEGAHSVPESSFGAPSEKGRVVLTNTRALQGEHSHGGNATIQISNRHDQLLLCMHACMLKCARVACG